MMAMESVPWCARSKGHAHRPPLVVSPDSVMNLKELRTLSRLELLSEYPKDVFNIICDNIIKEMGKHLTIEILNLRDHLYDILLYGLDITECLWYILFYFVEKGDLTDSVVLSQILDKIDSFLKRYNNNYRPIYHLESIFIYLITRIFKYDEPTTGDGSA
jgi:hypothetical protein